MIVNYKTIRNIQQCLVLGCFSCLGKWWFNKATLKKKHQVRIKIIFGTRRPWSRTKFFRNITYFKVAKKKEVHENIKDPIMGSFRQRRITECIIRFLTQSSLPSWQDGKLVLLACEYSSKIDNYIISHIIKINHYKTRNNNDSILVSLNSLSRKQSSQFCG